MKAYIYRRKSDEFEEILEIRLKRLNHKIAAAFKFMKGNIEEKSEYSSKTYLANDDWDAMNSILLQTKSYLMQNNVQNHSDFIDAIWNKFFYEHQPNLNFFGVKR